MNSPLLEHDTCIYVPARNQIFKWIYVKTGRTTVEIYWNKSKFKANKTIHKQSTFLLSVLCYL